LAVGVGGNYLVQVCGLGLVHRNKGFRQTWVLGAEAAMPAIVAV